MCNHIDNLKFNLFYTFEFKLEVDSGVVTRIILIYLERENYILSLYRLSRTK